MQLQTIQSHLQAFLDKHNGFEVIKTPVNGELLEDVIGRASYTYGNGELAIWLDNGCDDEPYIYTVDNYGQFNDVLCAWGDY